jgi:hypothetical protein
MRAEGRGWRLKGTPEPKRETAGNPAAELGQYDGFQTPAAVACLRFATERLV